MDFAEELAAMCGEVSGCRTAWVMSFDGISVASHQEREGGLDAEALLVELIGSLKTAAGAMGAVDAGDLDTIEMTTRKGTLLLNLLGEEYFVAMLLDPDALVGQGRYALRRHSLALKKELQ